jgi:aspartyl-tRNA synthetase
VFSALGLGPVVGARRSGWFVAARRSATPPHGGFAIGFDRLVMSLLGEAGIQDVIAFPKTLAASDLMCGAPAPVDRDQLAILGLRPAPENGG